MTTPPTPALQRLEPFGKWRKEFAAGKGFAHWETEPAAGPSPLQWIRARPLAQPYGPSAKGRMELPFLRISQTKDLSLVATCKPFAFSQKAQVARLLAAVAKLGSLAFMSRLLQCLVVALLLSNAGCSRKPDPVLASFVNAEFSTNRIVLYTSGKYECYGANDDGSLQNHPYQTGTFVGGVSNYVVSIEKGIFDSPDMRARKVYRIIKHNGVEYLFDEQSNGVKKFEETKDERELRHGWRREGG